ncbi:MAG: XRE family transcriptional regulator [Mailhella sp.]|nr:XRE family transcriptional regulator [Mailhella sp.]
MAKNFQEFVRSMPPESRARAMEKADAMLAEMPLQEVRRARGLSQALLAEALQVSQPSIAQMEKRTDMYISTLRSHIRAMGGELDVIAHFPDGDVRITNFSDLTEQGAKDIAAETVS